MATTTAHRELIVAVAENGVIGRNNDLPWRLPDDLRLFKRLTTGHSLIMGRNTWDSIGRPLPNRESIVVSTRLPTDALPEGVHLARSLDDAFTLASRPIAFVIGGARLFAEALPQIDTLHLTRVHATVDGNVSFPPLDFLHPPAWQRVAAEPHPIDPHHDHAFTYERWTQQR